MCINTNREHIQISSIQVTTLISPSMALLLTLGQFHSCPCLVEGIRITNQLAPNFLLLRATFWGGDPTWSDPINPQLGAKNLNASPGRFGSRKLMWRYGKIWWRCPTLVPEMTSVNQDQWSTNHDQNPDVANFANFGIVESCWIHLPAYQMHGTSKRTLGSLGMFQSADCNFYSCDLWEHHPWKTQECWGDHSWIAAFSGAALTSFLGLHKEFCGLWGWFVLQTQTCARSQMKATR